MNRLTYRRRREPKHTKNDKILSLHIFLALLLQEDLPSSLLMV